MDVLNSKNKNIAVSWQTMDEMGIDVLEEYPLVNDVGDPLGSIKYEEHSRGHTFKHDEGTLLFEFQILNNNEKPIFSIPIFEELIEDAKFRIKNSKGEIKAYAKLDGGLSADRKWILYDTDDNEKYFGWINQLVSGQIYTPSNEIIAEISYGYEKIKRGFFKSPLIKRECNLKILSKMKNVDERIELIGFFLVMFLEPSYGSRILF